jgi:hypothetical protein
MDKRSIAEGERHAPESSGLSSSIFVLHKACEKPRTNVLTWARTKFQFMPASTFGTLDNIEKRLHRLEREALSTLVDLIRAQLLAS